MTLERVKQALEFLKTRPEATWTTYTQMEYTLRGPAYCAVGHLGLIESSPFYKRELVMSYGVKEQCVNTGEAIELNRLTAEKLGIYLSGANNGDHYYSQLTPKQRVIACLEKLIEVMEAEEAVKQLMTPLEEELVPV